MPHNTYESAHTSLVAKPGGEVPSLVQGLAGALAVLSWLPVQLTEL